MLMLSSVNLQSRNSEIAIRVTNLSKVYQVYDRPGDRLKQSVLPRLQKNFGLAPRKYYREFWALKEVSFEVRKGETVGIIGRNGSGKSTLLKIICGTIYPTVGQVETNGRVAALLELGSGFNPEFTGRDNVFLSAAICGCTREEINSKLDDICNFADIGHYIDQPVKTYSSGMLVRLAFSVIAHVNAELLIIDEALAVGDVFFTQKCMRFLRNFMKTGTVLFVSHDTGAVINLCNRSIRLKNGLLINSGSTKEVVESYLEDNYAINNTTTSGNSNKKNTNISKKTCTPRDMRSDFLNQTNLRNDIKIFQFTENGKSFGKGGARISNVNLNDKDSIPLAWIVGGELSQLIIEFENEEKLENPIIGFQIKDHLGQVIFGDSTYLTYYEHNITVSENRGGHAVFEFRMPVLPVGDYSIAVAIAVGTQEKHIQQHWIHDAVILKSINSSICHGLIGIPMNRIELEIE